MSAIARSSDTIFSFSSKTIVEEVLTLSLKRGFTDHGAESASSDSCPAGEQRGPGRHPATARTGWTKEMNIAVMEC